MNLRSRSQSSVEVVEIDEINAGEVPVNEFVELEEVTIDDENNNNRQLATINTNMFIFTSDTEEPTINEIRTHPDDIICVAIDSMHLYDYSEERRAVLQANLSSHSTRLPSVFSNRFDYAIQFDARHHVYKASRYEPSPTTLRLSDNFKVFFCEASQTCYTTAYAY